MKTAFYHILTVATLLLLMVSCQTSTEQSTDANSETTTDNDAPVAAPAETPPSTPQELAQFAYGIDIAKSQQNEIDSLNVNTDSLSFVICKATEGVTYTDPYFTKNWATIPQRGFIRGAYHFYHTDDDPTQQATFFVNSLTGLNKDDLAPILDFEYASIATGKTVTQIQADLMVFLKAVEQQSGRKPIIYTSVNIGDQYLNKPEFAEYALWIAYPAEVANPKLPTAWATKGWSLWQKSWKYQIEGYTDDFDRYNGNLAALRQFISEY